MFLNANEQKYGIEIQEKNYSDRVTLKIKANSSIEEKLNGINKIIVIRL